MEILQQTGLLDSLLTKELLLVVTETNIRYMRELKLFDKIEIETTVTYESPYLVFNHNILNLSSEFKAAKAQVKTLLIDKERTPQDIPEELLAIVN